MHIAMLHTAQIHVGTFDALLQDSGARLTHHVAPELLTQAQTHGLKSVQDETQAALHELAKADAVICTCSTLGPIADQMGLHHVFRIDRPMMEKACTSGPRILVALCLESTRHPTLELLESCATQMETPITPDTLLIPDAWDHFQAGDQQAYGDTIAKSIRSALSNDITCIVLAQASMAVAMDGLGDISVPILTSPPLAAAAALRMGKGEDPSNSLQRNTIRG